MLSSHGDIRQCPAQAALNPRDWLTNEPNERNDKGLSGLNVKVGICHIEFSAWSNLRLEKCGLIKETVHMEGVEFFNQTAIIMREMRKETNASLLRYWQANVV